MSVHEYKKQRTEEYGLSDKSIRLPEMMEMDIPNSAVDSSIPYLGNERKRSRTRVEGTHMFWYHISVQSGEIEILCRTKAENRKVELTIKDYLKKLIIEHIDDSLIKNETELVAKF